MTEGSNMQNRIIKRNCFGLEVYTVLCKISAEKFMLKNFWSERCARAFVLYNDKERESE